MNPPWRKDDLANAVYPKSTLSTKRFYRLVVVEHGWPYRFLDLDDPPPGYSKHHIYREPFVFRDYPCYPTNRCREYYHVSAR